MRVLVLARGGLGNGVQATCVQRALSDAGETAEFHLVGCLYPPAVRKSLFHRYATTTRRYEGVVAVGWAGALVGGRRWNGLPVLNDPARQRMSFDRSEVDVCASALDDLGVPRPPARGLVNGAADGERFEFVFAAGRFDGRWSLKAWPGFAALGEMAGSRACCIGAAAGERVPGVVDKTGLPMSASLNLLAGAGCVVATDCGMYHAACALGVPTVVVFTFTSTVKNWDPEFHRTATVVSVGLPCQADCQRNGGWRKCQNLQCQNVLPESVWTLANRLAGSSSLSA